MATSPAVPLQWRRSSLERCIELVATLSDITLNERLFALPEPDAARVARRHAELPPQIAEIVRRAGDALDADRPDLARGILFPALAQAASPDVLRLSAMASAQLGNRGEAKVQFERALQLDAGAALTYRQYAQMLEALGDIDAARELRTRAVKHLPDSPLAWFDLGEHCFAFDSIGKSVDCLERAIALDPNYLPALLKLGSALVYGGRIDEGAVAYRRVIAIDPGFGAAWFSLANIKTLPFAPSEVEQMRQMLRAGVLRDPDRLLIQFALAKACEDAGSYPDAFELLMDANARKRGQVGWSAARFSQQVRHAEQVFAASHARVADPEFGSGIIFIVGLPRSGTTLTEQIIASHSRVEGANELGDLGRILTEESARLRQPYPDWVPHATPDDWRRLGQRYLDATAHWRRHRPAFTDKMPGNWLFIGAIRAMLPGARIVACRRDPLENCWSCFKQFFFAGWDFTFSLEDIAAYWKDFDRTISYWAKHEPEYVREQSYEALAASPETEIRDLLEFCGLPFEIGCLRFHESARSVRTASAGQVRQPLRRDTARAIRYGALLDPLRQALGLPLWDEGDASVG